MAKFAIVTGASAGIGAELAKLAAAEGYDLLLAADTPFTESVGNAQTLDVDLSTFEGVDRLLEAAGGRQIDLLCANAGHGLGRAFLEQDPAEWKHVVDTNIVGTAYLLQKVLPHMVARNDGKVLVTGSIAGYIPGAFQAVYNGTKAYLDSFSYALREELRESGIIVTVLMPGPTETEFFDRADMLDTKVGESDSKEDPAATARHGWDAMKNGDGHVVSGWKNKLQAAISHITTDSVLAKMHRSMAEPGSAKD